MRHPNLGAPPSTIGANTPTASIYGDVGSTTANSDQNSAAIELMQKAIGMLNDDNTAWATSAADMLKEAIESLDTAPAEPPIDLQSLNRVIDRGANQVSFRRYGVAKTSSGRASLSKVGWESLLSMTKQSNGVYEITESAMAGLDALMGRTDWSDETIGVFADRLTLLCKLAESMPEDDDDTFIADKSAQLHETWNDLTAVVKKAETSEALRKEIRVPRNDQGRLPSMARGAHAEDVFSAWAAEDKIISDITNLTLALKQSAHQLAVEE